MQVGRSLCSFLPFHVDSRLFFENRMGDAVAHFSIVFFVLEHFGFDPAKIVLNSIDMRRRHRAVP